MTPTRPLELAREWMRIVFAEGDPDALRSVMAPHCTVRGPLFELDRREPYIEALRSDPPTGFGFDLLHSFESESAACLIYEFAKPGVRTIMAQLFEVEDGSICHIELIFDATGFDGSEDTAALPPR